MVIQPVQVEQPLADQIGGHAALILDHHRYAVSIKTERVDASLMPGTNGIFQREEEHAEQDVEMPLHQYLE